MKKVAITIVLLFSIMHLYAQRGAIEVGIGTGVSVNSDVSGNMVYKGNIPTVNQSFLLNALYNVHPNISVGMEARVLGLSRKSDSVYYINLNTKVGGDGRRLVYSKNMLSTCIVANGKYPMRRGYMYGGLALGYGFSMHKASDINIANESYRAPNDGSGIAYGIQAGYTYGINQVMALNIEGALRRYNLSYTVAAPDVFPKTNLEFATTAYALTFGVKFRIIPKGKTENEIPAFRGKGRSY